MKTTLTLKLAATLLLIVSSSARAQTAHDAKNAPNTPKQLTLTFELQDLPGRNQAKSFWEVSFTWRIADQQEFNRWSREGENPTKRESLGRLLTKQSFVRRNLAAPESRHLTIAVPMDKELLGRLQNAQRRPQIVWLDATVRVHDTKLGTDVIKRVNPVWGPDFCRVGAAKIRMELTNLGTLRWYAGDTAPWEQKHPYRVNAARVP